MAFNLPRISIVLSDPNGMESQGELTMMSVGFGLHQAWIYATIFGTAVVFPATDTHPFENVAGIPVPSMFLAAIISFSLTLLISGFLDQKAIGFFTSKKVLAASAVATAIGTILVAASMFAFSLGTLFSIVASLFVGIPSAILLIFWGTAFARKPTSSIVMNTAMAMAIAACIYVTIVHVTPAPFSGILTVLLPILELPVIWNCTPDSYSKRHAVPMFAPLPINKKSFGLHLALAMLFFGVALGSLRSIATQDILPASDPSLQMLALMLASFATVILLVGSFYATTRIHWDFLFRPLVPLVVVASLVLPLAYQEYSLGVAFLLLTGYMCFEASMWTFFGEMGQEFRISPIYLVGLGRGALALGSAAGTALAINPHLIDDYLPVDGGYGTATLIILVMVLAYGIMPRAHNIKQLVGNSKSALSHIESSDDATQETPYTTVDVVENAQQGIAVTTAPEEAEEPMADAARELEMKTRNDDEDGRPTRQGRFRLACERIANDYMLSRRETEVLFLLAKGHNAAYIQDKLCITRSTTKTHIYHIYQKLNIHTQNELLNIVEGILNDNE